MNLDKYLAAERTDVLESRSLRFTQAQDFNDPFEVLPNINARIPPEKLRDYFAQFEARAQRDFERMLREELAGAGLPSEVAMLLPL